MNATAATRYPRVIDEIVRRNWEIAANGVDMGHVHHGQARAGDESASSFSAARETLTKVIGQAIAGWHSPGHSQSANTLMLLAESGFEYVTDWANDDMPYMMKTAAGPLCAMPLTYEWSDRVLLVQHNLTVEDYEAQVLQAFQRLHAEAEQHGGGRILSLSVIAVDSRLPSPHSQRWNACLARSWKPASVWHATGMEIVDAFKAANADDDLETHAPKEN